MQKDFHLYAVSKGWCRAGKKSLVWNTKELLMEEKKVKKKLTLP